MGRGSSKVSGGSGGGSGGSSIAKTAQPRKFDESQYRDADSALRAAQDFVDNATPKWRDIGAGTASYMQGDLDVKGIGSSEIVFMPFSKRYEIRTYDTKDQITDFVTAVTRAGAVTKARQSLMDIAQDAIDKEFNKRDAN